MVCDQIRLKLACSATDTKYMYRLEIVDLASLSIILS